MSMHKRDIAVNTDLGPRKARETKREYIERFEKAAAALRKILWPQKNRFSWVDAYEGYRRGLIMRDVLAWIGMPDPYLSWEEE